MSSSGLGAEAMPSGTIRVLVAEEVRDFISSVEVPADVEVEWLAADEAIPKGDYAGLLPLLSRRIDAAAFDRLPELRVVANYAVGHDNIDFAVARARGIVVSNTPDVLSEATADLCWALILAACRRFPEAEALARSGAWSGWHPTQLLGMEMRGSALGILGAGRIGWAVARRAPAFGMRLLYWDSQQRPSWESELDARRIEPLPDALGAADVISIHLPLTAETRGLIGREQIDQMKDGAVLVNTARGGIVDQKALCDALGSGKLSGAGLDVYEDEPEIDECLLRCQNVVLLPHIASATEETRRRMFELAWANLMRGVRGEPLLTPVAGEAEPGEK